MRFLIALLLTMPAFGQWPQFRGNPQLTGVSSEKLPTTLKLLWTWEGGAESFESSPAISDGTVYIGAQMGDLIAVDLATGKLKWRYKTGKDIGESSPAVANGIVYIADYEDRKSTRLNSSHSS